MDSMQWQPRLEINRNNISKRFFDVFFATIGLLLSLPLFVIVALLVKFSSKGPILFRQKRLTMAAKQFDIMKFRTMYVDFDKRGIGIQVQGNSSGITPVGRWLRKTKLDEIPQLLNIIKGDMSFVGPRPELPRRLGRYAPKDFIVFSVRSGISSPASVALSDEEQLMNLVGDPERFYMEKILPLKIELNTNYVRNSDLLTDLLIILATLGKIFGLVLFKTKIYPTDLDRLRQKLETAALDYR